MLAATDLAKTFTEIKNVVEGALGNLLWFLAGLFVLWARKNIYYYLIIKRIVIVFFTKKNYILIWNDDTVGVSRKIVERLQTKGLNNFRYKTLKEPEEILYYPSRYGYVHSIVFIVTDVTKISEDLKKREKVQEKLVKYADNGGVLVGTHDLIYRRCRNKILQESFGCEIYQFERHTAPIKVEIKKEFENHPLLKSLPKTYQLLDGEVTTGSWDPDVDVLVCSSESCFKDSLNCFVPVVCLKKTPANGVLIWLSSGDKIKDEEHAKSLDQPEFSQILFNANCYKQEIKDFVKQPAITSENIA